MIVERFSISFNVRHTIQFSTVIECERTRGRTCTSNVLPWRIPQPSKHCAYVHDDHQTPAPEDSTLSILQSHPLPCLVSPSLVPISKKNRSSAAQQICFTPVLDSGRSRHHDSPRDSQDMQCSSVSSLIQIRRTSTAMLARHT